MSPEEPGSSEDRPQPPAPPEETLVSPAGKFRLYLGAAAGVGKTCAMLDEGWRRRERGRDVVIGYVETHGRPHTAQFIRDLETVPRKQVQHRGGQFEEMDLDAVLARRPDLALVDELAHSNVPGSGRHQKRWEDIVELLANGINVISTVNIQHLESLADSIERMTGTAIRERVPDWVVRRADQTELVDSSPEQLRRRMIHGNVYPPDRVAAALSHFFSEHNLTVLRDLALRFVADETEEALLHQLEEASPGQVETEERILAAVVPGPLAGHLLRRAARMAARAKGQLTAVHVLAGESLHRSDQASIRDLEALALNLGAEWRVIHGDEVAPTLVRYACEHGMTQLVIGADRERGWGIGRGGTVRQVLREAAAAGMDVHVIAPPPKTPASPAGPAPAEAVGGR